MRHTVLVLNVAIIWGVFVLNLELALFYINIEQNSQLPVPTSHLHNNTYSEL